jgi:dTDP-6-deoxy-L-talose 4-dehydrogenase (NAD+)
LRQAALRGDAEFPMSGGEQLRDYLPVETVAQSLAKVSLLPEATGILNICSGRPVSIRSLVEQWIAAGNWRIEPRLGCYPYPEYEPMAFWGDAARLEAFLA